MLRALGSYLEHGPKLAQHRALIKETLREEIERGAQLTALEIAEAEAGRSRLLPASAGSCRVTSFWSCP